LGIAGVHGVPSFSSIVDIRIGWPNFMCIAQVEEKFGDFFAERLFQTVTSSFIGYRQRFYGIMEHPRFATGALEFSKK
jgi:hypothetical protein